MGESFVGGEGVAATNVAENASAIFSASACIHKLSHYKQPTLAQLANFIVP